MRSNVTNFLKNWKDDILYFSSWKKSLCLRGMKKAAVRMQISAKNWYRNKETFFFLIHKSVNIGNEWNFAEGSQSAEMMNFSLWKVTCIKKMREIRLYTGSQLPGRAQRQFKTSSTNSAGCQRAEYCKDNYVKLHLKHFIHYNVDIHCIFYPHIYTYHSKTARGLLFFFFF